MLEEIATETLPDPPGFARFLDRTLADRWAAYHAQQAKLRLVHAFINLSQPRKPGNRPWYERWK